MVRAYVNEFDNKYVVIIYYHPPFIHLRICVHDSIFFDKCIVFKYSPDELKMFFDSMIKIIKIIEEENKLR